MRQIDIAIQAGGSVCYIGNVGVSASDHVALITTGSEFMFGPFEPGIGIRPNGIYLLGTAGQKITWSGVPA
jgi:hypothetical protein